MNDYTLEEVREINALGNIKSILVTHTKAQLWNETDTELIYDVQVRQLSHSEIRMLNKCKLYVWSVFVNKDNTMSVKIARSLKA